MPHQLDLTVKLLNKCMFYNWFRRRRSTTTELQSCSYFEGGCEVATIQKMGKEASWFATLVKGGFGMTPWCERGLRVDLIDD